jgi:hypothetical protein
MNQNKDVQRRNDEERRKLLLQLGRLAVYTPPVLMTLVVSPRASAASLGPPPNPPGPNSPGRPQKPTGR